MAVSNDIWFNRKIIICFSCSYGVVRLYITFTHLEKNNYCGMKMVISCLYSLHVSNTNTWWESLEEIKSM